MTTLENLLHIDLILLQILPDLPIASRLALASTCRSLRTVVFDTPGSFRHTDLSGCRTGNLDHAPLDRGGEIWRAERMDEGLTEDEFYGGPLRGILSQLRRWRVLEDVQTLVLDRQSVTSDVLFEIICGDEYRVRLLSLLEVRHLNMSKFQRTLTYACRPSREEGRPWLKGVYLFSDADPPVLHQNMDHLHDYDQGVGGGIMSTAGAQLGAQYNQRSRAELFGREPNPYYRAAGSKQNFLRALGWEGTLNACRDIIAFDAVLCRGPRHGPLGAVAGPAIASVYLGTNGCETCGSVPEEAAFAGKSPISHVPLLRPIPAHSSSAANAQLLPHSAAIPKETAFIARCRDCVAERCCEGCNRFWCENCYNAKPSDQQIPPIPQPDDDPNQQPVLQVGAVNSHIKVYMNFCTESCLVSMLYSGPGEGGMWG